MIEIFKENGDFSHNNWTLFFQKMNSFIKINKEIGH
jgi:hypothetical protein